METIETKAYKCQYCGSIHLSLDDAVRCELICEAKRKVEADREAWYESNEPKYAEGDVVEVIDSYCHNKYFRITSVSKADKKEYLGPHWRYYGEVGSNIDGFFDPETYDDIAEDDIKCLICASAKFEAVCKTIKERFQAIYSEVRVIHNSVAPMVELVTRLKIEDYAESATYNPADYDDHFNTAASAEFCE